MFFSYDHLRFRYEPFPIGIAAPLIDETTYEALVESYPPVERFAYLPKLGHKYSLSERFAPREYEDVIRNTPVWREFHRWAKSDEFIDGAMEALRAHHIELGYKGREGAAARVARAWKALRGNLSARPAGLRTRFEFSMLPADGGHILPHTDAPSKIVTLVVSMLREGEWDPAFGGGTDVNRPKDPSRGFNRVNDQAGFEDVEVLDTFEFEPNQAVVFVKTFNSWHSVRPMKGAGTSTMRKTLTINIESLG